MNEEENKYEKITNGMDEIVYTYTTEVTDKYQNLYDKNKDIYRMEIVGGITGSYGLHMSGFFDYKNPYDQLQAVPVKKKMRLG